MRTRFATALVLAAMPLAAAPARAQESGSGGTAYTPPPVAPLVAGGLLGTQARWNGRVAGPGAVRIDRFDPASSTWTAVANTTAGDDGAFTAAWRTDALGSSTVRAVLDGSDEATAPTTRATVYRPARATWYGPGFFGKRTACGTRLTRATLGVAHKRLPCGSQVDVFYNGRAITVPVIDRGPFANGASYDLTQATANALGVRETVRVGVLPRPTAATAGKRKKRRS